MSCYLTRPLNGLDWRRRLPAMLVGLRQEMHMTMLFVTAWLGRRGRDRRLRCSLARWPIGIGNVATHITSSRARVVTILDYYDRDSRKGHSGRRLLLGNAGPDPQIAGRAAYTCWIQRRRGPECYVLQPR